MVEEGFFMNAIERNLSMVQGDTMSFAFQVKGLEGQEPDGLQFSCKSSLENENYVFAVVLGDNINLRDYDAEHDIFTYAVRIPPSCTAGVAAGRYFYDLELKCNGDVLTLMIGRLDIVPEVTKTEAAPAYANGDNDELPLSNIPVGEKKLYTVRYISDIAEAIQNITGSSEPLKAGDLAEAVEALPQNALDALFYAEETQAANFALTDEHFKFNRATVIPSYAFYNMDSLKEINVSNIVRVKGNAFFHNTHLVKVILPDCETIDNYAFMECHSGIISDLQLPKCKTLGEWAFREAKVRINELVLPEVETMGDGVFTTYYSNFRSEINTLRLPNIKTIGRTNFMMCNNIYIGDKIESIDGGQFQDIDGITNRVKLQIEATTPPEYGTMSFGVEPDYPWIFVPASAVNAYKSASGWSGWADYITAIVEE